MTRNFLLCPDLTICFEEPYNKMTDAFDINCGKTCMMITDEHELCVAWKTNTNDTNLYQYNVCILNGKSCALLRLIPFKPHFWFTSYTIFLLY